MNWYKKANVDGEWWITDTGETLFADGDRGDYNHEAYVLEAIIGNYFDLDDPENPDMYQFENMPEEELIEAGMTPEEIKVIYNQIDAREYAMKNWKWIRVADKYIQSWYLTSDILKNLANGLYEAYGDDAFKNTFVISSMSNGKNYSPVPYEVINSGSPRNLMQYLEFDPMNLIAFKNWYKKAQNIEVVEQKDSDYKNPNYMGYGMIGHDWYYDDGEDEYSEDYNSNNYMWVFIDGKVDVEPETKQNNAHPNVERWDKLITMWSKIYKGRYDSRQKMISVVKPTQGIGEFRDIPKAVQYALKQNFPEAEQLHVFSNSKNWYKQAQINGGKVKYGPDGSFFILGKNTKQGEGPWRISYFDEKGHGWTHKDFKTYNDALLIFNSTYGTEEPLKKEKYELV